MKRVLTLVLSAIMLIILIPVPQAQAATLSLAQLQEKFPDGAYWNHVTVSGHGYSNYNDRGSCNNPDGYTWSSCYSHSADAPIGQHDCNSFDGGVQCCGFARKLAYDAYGSRATSWTQLYGNDAVSYVSTSLKPGDVIHYTGGGADATYGHWVFVTGVDGNTFSVAECGIAGKTCMIRWGHVYYKSNITPVQVSVAPSELYASDAVNHGDSFYASIYRLASPDERLTVGEAADTTLVYASGRNNSARQRWLFTRQSDGSYKIRSEHNGYFLNVDNGSSADGTLATLWQDLDNNYQKWYIYEADGGYKLVSKGTGDCLNIYAGSVGLNATLSTYGGYAEQILNIHVHRYTSSTEPPTCASEGYTHYACECGDYYNIGNGSTSDEHSWELADWQDATCSENGYLLYVCENCGDIKEEFIPVTDHSWAESKRTEATCQQPATVIYTCEGCGESRTEILDGEFSEWSEIYPEGVSEDLIETKTQYRYRDYETTASSSSSVSGMELVGSEWVYQNTQTVDYAIPWPSGFYMENSLFKQYDNRPVENSETNTTKIVVTGSANNGYIMWHWCRGTYYNGPINRAMSDVWTGEFNTFHAFYSDNNGSNTDSNGSNGGGDHVRYYHNNACCADTYWYFAQNVTRQTYDTYQKMYTHGKWGAWSEWTDTAYTESDTRQVETRTLYRYVNVSDGLHDWDEGVVTTPASCTEPGEKTYTCILCGETYTDSYADSTGHSYEAVVTDPTCTEGGYTTYTCACGDSYTGDHTTSTGHSYGSWSQTKAPTCTVAGTERRDCNKCDHYETRTVAATGHSYTSVVTKPTCTEAGYTTYTCACGDSYTGNETAATGHSYGAWTQTKAPTCTATGTERRGCNNCDHYETRSVAKISHSYTSVVTEPTCTEDGYTTYTCSCGDSYTGDEVTALGHDITDGLCDRCGNVFLAIVQQPQSVDVRSGETAAVTVEAVGEGLTYTWYYKNPGASSFTRTTAFTGPTYSVEMTEARSGRQVYCLVKDQYGNKVQSDIVTLTMYKTPLQIITQPESVEVKSGETALVEFEAQGDGLTYTWYYKNSGSSSFSKTSTFTGPSYSVAMSAARDGRQVYCLVTDQYGSKVKTDVVTLSVYKTPLAIVTQPVSVEVKSGETAAVTLEAQGDGLTYTWYYKNSGSSSFSKTTSFTGPSYSVAMSASRSGRQVYCLVKDEYGNKVKSDVVTLTMHTTPLAIVSQSGDVTVGAGETAVVTVEATGDDLTYEWYYKNAGASSYKKTSTFTGPRYTLEMNASRSGRQVYCKITDAYGNTVKTKSVLLTMETTPLEIVTQPEGFTIAEGKTGKIKVEATGDGLTYEWYYKNATASKFTKTSTFTGPEYSLTMNGSRSGRHVYCKITDSYGNSVTTDIVTLNMESELEMIEQPEDVIAVNGETVEITVFADGKNLKYAWYYRNAGKSEFTKTSTFKGDSYSLEMNSTRNGREVYCVITDSYGNTVATDVITFRMV